MRIGWLALVGLTACSQAEYLGSFRLPMPASTTSVSLVTVLAKEDDGWLVLYDTAQKKELGRGRGDLSSLDPTMPFAFDVPAGAPLQLLAVDGVLQDVETRGYQTIPLTSLQSGARSVTRLTLTEGSDTLKLVSAGGALFAEAPASQPATTDTPGPLFALNSVAGVGLALPAKFETVANWHDAITNYVPPNAQMPIACAAPFVSASRTASTIAVDVPAGHFDTLPVVEVVDNCQQPNPPELLVYRVDRWFAAGVGPVWMKYTDSSSHVHEYRLTSSHVTGGSKEMWPLQAGNTWTYEVHDATGAVVNPAAVVTVSASDVIQAP
jgi:hypothetical protein